MLHVGSGAAMIQSSRSATIGGTIAEEGVSDRNRNIGGFGLTRLISISAGLHLTSTSPSTTTPAAIFFQHCWSAKCAGAIIIHISFITRYPSLLQGHRYQQCTGSGSYLTSKLASSTLSISSHWMQAYNSRHLLLYSDRVGKLKSSLNTMRTEVDKVKVNNR